MEMRFSTPLLQQWQQAVDSHPGILVLIRVGDFYETYAEQAEDVAKILKITLTSRQSRFGTGRPKPTSISFCSPSLRATTTTRTPSENHICL